MRYSLDEIDTFLTVMELGTVTAAASRMNLSKSVVSKRITDLENGLKTALFRRNAGRIRPTEAAHRLSERLRPALGELRAAAESVARDADATPSLRGKLSIAAPTSFGVMYLGPVLAEFAVQNPELELRVDYDDRVRDLIHDGIDVSIRIGIMRDTALMARKICDDFSVPCASPAYLERRGAPRDIADLRDHEILGYSHLANARQWDFDAGTGPIPLQSRITLNNGEAIRDFALAGLGLAIVPGFIVAEEIASGRLVRVLPDHKLRRIPISVVWPPVIPMPHKLRVFIDHLIQAIGDCPPWHDLLGPK